MPVACETPTIIVTDAMELRRACIISLLEPWADARGLALASLALEETPGKLVAGCCCRMLIISFGGESILRRENLRYLKVLRALLADIPLVIVSDNADPDEVAAALNLGAQGFLHTEISPELAMQAFSFILNGGSYFPPSAMRQLQSRMELARDTPADRANGSDVIDVDPKRHCASAAPRAIEETETRAATLTARQRAVLEHLCHGEPNKLIARRLGMTEGTVKVHVRQIMRKLGAANRTQAAVCAMTPDTPWGQSCSIDPMAAADAIGKPFSRSGPQGAASNN